ncbi:serine/threonine-protein kinase [Kitasatospora herbaricolor]|uniref:non-specific serine/threonine protein kinase n=1 Tax=Kitasatospora herbaricolor TaxID=68217 RepID=A0ABZ1WGJ5_9ACTN|nr:protein kinase [Kitasatospora herbaricolor]
MGDARYLKPLGPDDPQELAGYRLLARLGAGGMGVVYLSYTRGRQPVALKVIRNEYTLDAEFRRRFQHEVRAARQVSGYHIVPVVDHDTTGERPWLASSFVAGLALDEALDEGGPLPVATTLQLVGAVAEALRAIHAAGVIHRDLKPSNILLGADGPWVIDFGIARAADATKLTRSGGLIGTPEFMSPEHAGGEPLTPASDIFSLALVAAVAATGRHPYGSGGTITLVAKIVNTAFRPPELGGYPEPLRGILERCLAADPADRPTAGELAGLCAEAVGQVPHDFAGWLPEPVLAEIARRAGLAREAQAEAVRTDAAGGVPLDAPADAPVTRAPSSAPPKAPPGAPPNAPSGAPPKAPSSAPSHAPAHPSGPFGSASSTGSPQTGPHRTLPPSAQPAQPEPPSQAPRQRTPDRPPAPPQQPAPQFQASQFQAPAPAYQQQPGPYPPPYPGGPVPPVPGTTGPVPAPGGNRKVRLALAAVVAAVVAVSAVSWIVGQGHKSDGASADGTKTPGAVVPGVGGGAQPTGGGAKSGAYVLKFEDRPLTINGSGHSLYTTVDFDAPKVKSGQDVYEEEWEYFQAADKSELVFEEGTGRSADKTAEKCRQAADGAPLRSPVTMKQLPTVMPAGTLLCTVTTKGDLAMLEITALNPTDEFYEIVGRLTVWSLPG